MSDDTTLRRDQIGPLLQELEQRQRDHSTASGPPIWGPQIQAQAFWQVQALARFWDHSASHPQGEEVDYAQHMADLLTGSHGPGRTMRFLIASTGKNVGIYLSLHDETAAADQFLPALLHGTFPGIELSPKPLANLGKALYAKGMFAHMGMLTGIPTLKLRPKPQEGRGSAEQIERVLRGLSGSSWGYLVVAAAVPQPRTLNLALQGMQRVTQVSALVQEQISRQSGRAELVDNLVQTVTRTADQTHYDAKTCLELLEKNLERLQIARAEGLWQVQCYYFASSGLVLAQLGALLRGIFAGLDSAPEPVRTIVRQTDPNAADRDAELQTLLNTRELATLVQLPREEFPAYALRDYVRFDSDLPKPEPTDGVVLGEVLDGNRSTGYTYSIERREFTKHGLIAGVTGSGKTTTVFSLLDQLYQQGRGTPFLVIEPAKTEYRALLQATGRFPQLRIYTLGDERCAPFRLNPFAFAIGDAQHRIHVQTHIDFLKAVFNAAFVLYAPMPYVLETCLHEVYVDKGWDLAGSINQRLPFAQQGNELQWPVFPTLGDLYGKVDEVVDRLGYEDRIAMDVKAGLKARIGSLRLGGKGFMLDCRYSVPMHELVACPTILEMAPIGNEDEKAFVIGLLLTALYEHLIIRHQMAAAASTPGGKRATGLVHLTVLEEAHRLLKNVSTEVSTESANNRGQAVETFTNMLSEIRSYGEGVLIAEQIPTKLAPDAIKNTNLKIVHRLLAGDDREVLAATMNMSEEQSRFLTTLRAGQAIVHAEGADRPYWLALHDIKTKISGMTTDAEIAQHMAGVIAQPLYDPTPDFAQHFPATILLGQTQTSASLSAIRTLAINFVDQPGFTQKFDRYVLSIVEAPERAAAGFTWLARQAQQNWIADALVMPVVLYALLVAVERHNTQRGQQYGWPYHRISNSYVYLRQVLAEIARNYPYHISDYNLRSQVLRQLTAAVQPAALQFQTAYSKLTKAHAPYDLCQACTTQCRFRFEAESIVQRADTQQALRRIFDIKDDKEMWKQLAEHCRTVAAQIVRNATGQPPRDAAICVAVHSALGAKFTVPMQTKMVRNVVQLLP